MISTVRCLVPSGSFLEGELYHAAAVRTEGGDVVYIIRNDTGRTTEFPDKRFRKEFEAVKMERTDDDRPTLGGYRMEFSDSYIQPAKQTALGVARREFKEALVSGSDEESARQTAATAAQEKVESEYFLTRSELESILSDAANQAFDKEIEECRVLKIVKKLLEN